MFKKCIASMMVLAIIALTVPQTGSAADVYSVRLYFGLSLPGGGAVSLGQWSTFLSDHIAETFDGFNVMDSVGYWKDKPERSKIVTIIVQEDQIPKAEKLAATYATQFHQDSVMLVQLPVAQWKFVKSEKAHVE